MEKVKSSIFIFTIITSLNSFCQKKTIFKDVYVYETPSKIYGKAYVNFVTLQDGKPYLKSFKINYDKNKIKKISETGYLAGSNDLKIQNLEDGNIKIGNHKAFKSDDFKKNIIYNKKLYELLDANFLNLNNESKLAFFLNSIPSTR